MQLKVGDVCISLTHRSQNALVDSKSQSTSNVATPPATSTVGDMRPPPVPPADRERHRSRSSSPAPLNRSAARLSPLKQVVFSDRVVLHSPPSSDAKLKTSDVENGSKIKLESRSDEFSSNLKTARLVFYRFKILQKGLLMNVITATRGEEVHTFVTL